MAADRGEAIDSGRLGEIQNLADCTRGVRGRGTRRAIPAQSGSLRPGRTRRGETMRRLREPEAPLYGIDATLEIFELRLGFILNFSHPNGI